MSPSRSRGSDAHAATSMASRACRKSRGRRARAPVPVPGVKADAIEAVPAREGAPGFVPDTARAPAKATGS
eukprot:12277051-Alexandrium_andersonii.AAC.1